MKGESLLRRQTFGRLRCGVVRALLVCSLAWPLPLAAWWETGHQTVARIAAAHLTAAARTRVARILDVADNPDAVADALARASTWADETKNETHTGEWHYIDLAIQDHKSDMAARCPQDDCAPARIRSFAALLAAHPEDARWSQLDALRYVVHLVGDIHQPLHAISDADLGGNCEALDLPIGKAKNLHALWDGELVNAIEPDDKALTAELERDIAKMDEWRQRELASGHEEDWTWESHMMALREVYQRLKIPVEPVEFPAKCEDAPAEIRELRLNLGRVYINDMKPVVREQLEKAGLRLAKLLNETF